MARSKDASASSKSLILIAIVLTIAALYLGRQIFIPLALALVFSFLLTPFVTFLQRMRFGRVPAVLTVLALAFILAGAMAWGVSTQLVQILVELPDYKENLDAKIQALHATRSPQLNKATATVQELNKELVTLPKQISPGRTQSGDQKPTRPVSVQLAQPQSSLVEDLRALLGPLAGPIETAAIVVIFTAFMLVKREDLRNRTIRLAGHGQLRLMTQALDDAGRRLSRYLLLQCLVNAGYGLLFGVGLYFIGVPHAMLWGVFGGLLRFLPYIGSLIGAVLPVVMALAVFPGWHHAALAFALFVLLELTVSNVVEPLLYGAHTGISSLAILVAAVFWGMIWGSVGLILSTPLTVCLIVLGRHVPQLKFLEVLLGDEPVLLPEQCFYQRLLARDREEARSIAEAHLKNNSLESLYDTIILPALKLVEEDYQQEGLNEGARRFALRSVKELIDDLGEAQAADAPVNNEQNEDYVTVRLNDPSPLTANVTCIAAAGGPDELVAIMLSQVLHQAGCRARALRAASAEKLALTASRFESNIVCVSAISPFAGGEARTLCRKLRGSIPNAQIVMGIWNLDRNTAQQKLGPGCPGSVATTFSEAVEQIRKLADPKLEDLKLEDRGNVAAIEAAAENLNA